MARQKITKLSFVSKIKIMPHTTCSIPGNGLTPAQIKKRARLQISKRYASKKLGFLHATLVKINGRHFLLAGPSGVGKTSCASYLCFSNKATIMANDWVVVENKDNEFYISDLNLRGELKHEKPLLLSGLILLTKKDIYARDAFVPSDGEYKRLIKETFEIPDDKDTAKLYEFWLSNKKNLPFYCAIPTRMHEEVYVHKTLIGIIRTVCRPTKTMKVGIIGVGNIGSLLAFQLGQIPPVVQVKLFSKDNQVVSGRALDMNQAVVDSREPKFIACNSPDEIFSNTDIVFITLRDKTPAKTRPGLPERWQRIDSHLKIVHDYVKIACSKQFKGVIIMVTNPVDILTYACYYYSQTTKYPLRTYQIYGAGLELDARRGRAYARSIGEHLTANDISIYGSHGEDTKIINTAKRNLNTRLESLVRNASNEIRDKGVSRTTFGPVSSIIEVLVSIINGAPVHATVVQNGSYIGRKVNFRWGLPQFKDQSTDQQHKIVLKDNHDLIKKHLIS